MRLQRSHNCALSCARNRGVTDKRGNSAEPPAGVTEAGTMNQHTHRPGESSGGSTPHEHHPAGHGEREPEGGHGGHDKHAGHSVAMFRDKFWISLALTIPTLVWGHMLPRVSATRHRQFLGTWIAPVFGTAVFLYGGLVFLQGAWREIRDRLPGMMTLIALAITVAFGFSLAVTLGYPGMPLWEELATLVTIMLLGHWIEMRSISPGAGRAPRAGEAAARHRTAACARPASVEEVPVDALRTGDIVLVRPGASIPADGVVVEGTSEVNESMITGESRPVKKAPGDKRDRGDGERGRIASRRGDRHR